MNWFKATGPFNPNRQEAGVHYPADAPRRRLLVKYGGDEKLVAMADEIRLVRGELVAYDYLTNYWFRDITGYAVLTADVLGEDEGDGDF